MSTLPFSKTQAVRKTKEEYLLWKTRIHGLDGWRCVRCQSARNLTVHHVVRRSKVRLDTDENGMTLCQPCHELENQHCIAVGWDDPVRRVARWWVPEKKGEMFKRIYEE